MNVMGSLLFELGVNMAAFQTGMTKATYAAKQASRDIANSFNQMGSTLESVLGQFGTMGAVVGQALGQAATTVSGFAGALGSVGGAAGAAAIGVSLVGGAAVAAGVALSTLAVQGGEIAHNLEMLSQKFGIGVHDLQTFQAMGDVVGVSLESMAMGMRKFDQAITGSGKSAGQAGAVLKSLNVTSHDQKEALLQVFDAFSKMQDGPRKAADAIALFGRAGLGLIPILNEGRAGFEKYQVMVDQFGPKLGEAGAAEMKYKDSQEKLSLSFDQLKVSATPVLGILSRMTTVAAGTVKGLGQLLTGDLSFKNVGFNKGAAPTPGVDPAEAAKAAAAKATADAFDKETASAQKTFEILKEGGPKSYALAQAQKDLAAALLDANQAAGYAAATEIQERIPALQLAAEAEKKADGAAKQLAEEIKKESDNTKESIALFGQGALSVTLYKMSLDGATYAQKQKVLADTLALKQMQDYAAMTKIITAQNNASYVQGADDAIVKEGADLDALMPKLEMQNDISALMGNSTNVIVKNSIFDIEEALQKQLDATQKVTNAQLIQEAVAQGASPATIANLKLMDAQITKFGLDSQRVDEVWQKLGDTMASGLANVIETGKGLTKMFQGLVKQIEDAVIKEALLGTSGKGQGGLISGGLFGGINQATGGKFGSTGKGQGGGIIGDMLGLFGIKGGGGASVGSPDGSQMAPLYTISVDQNGNPLATLGAGGQDLSKMLGNGFGSASKTSGGGGGFGGIMSLIGMIPGLAGGGDVSPGKAYIVGEKQPELFVPGTSGRIVPNFAAAPAQHQTTVQMHIHGVTDSDSFKKSQTQITGAMGSAVTRAQQRQGRG